MTTPSVPPAVRESIMLGPGTAVPVPYFDPRAAESESSGNAVWSILHAVRRRWFAIAVLGLIAGGSAGASTWYLVKSQSTAVVRLRVPSRDESLVVEERRVSTDFDLKKRTEQQTITGIEVLNSTLAQLEAKDLARMPELRDLTHDERLAYVRTCVSANFVQDSEIMELRVRCLDRGTAHALAQKITDVYLKEQEKALITKAEQVQDLQQRLAGLTERFTQQQNLLTMQERLEAPDTETLTPEEQAIARDFNAYLERCAALNKDIFETELRLAVLQQSSTEAGAPAGELVSEEELNTAALRVSQIQDLRQKIETLKEQRDTAGEGFSGKGYEIQVRKKTGEIERAETELAGLLEELQHYLEDQKRATATATGTVIDPAALQHRLTVLRTRLETEKLNAPPGLPGAGGGPDRTASIELYRMAVDDLKRERDQVQTLLTIAENSRLSDLEQQRKVGIRRVDPNNEVFVLDDDDVRRKLIQAGGAGSAAFMGVALLIVLLDLRRRRLNDTGDVSEQLQINVLGTVPLLRGKGSKRMEQSSRLAEAVDGVAATLLCRTAGEDHRVVMISSAMAGEGKTTLAANLATSLAAAGRRTLLVDFDLRRPMLHQVYQLPIAPGLGDVLADDDLANYTQYLQETMTEGLWLLTAGAKRQRAIAELADDRIADLFLAFKEHFEFIIVDGPPVLPVVDTRLVARHADGVVISLLRDVSELPKVKSACQLLQSYRVRILGGVVIGATGDVYYGYPPERIGNTA